MTRAERTVERMAAIIQMHDLGHKAPEIGRHLSITTSAIHRYLRKAGREPLLESDAQWNPTAFGLPAREKRAAPVFAVPIEELPPRVERDPCGYCGVRADVGCRHLRMAA